MIESHPSPFHFGRTIAVFTVLATSVLVSVFSPTSVLGQAKVKVTLGPPFAFDHLDIRAWGMGRVGVAVPDMAYTQNANPALLMETRCLGASLGFGGVTLVQPSDMDLAAAHISVGEEVLGIPIAVALSYQVIKGGFFDTYADPTIESAAFQVRARTVGLSIAGRPWYRICLGYALKRFELEPDVHTGFSTQADAAWSHDFGVYLWDLLPQATWLTHPAPALRLPHQEDWSLERRNGLSVGFAIRNISTQGRTFEGLVESPTLPEMASLGLSYRPVNTGTVGVLLVSEFNRPFDYDEPFDDKMTGLGDMFVDVLTFSPEVDDSVRVGIEINFLHAVDLRLGYQTDCVSKNKRDLWTYGFGIGTERIQFNLAYAHRQDEWLVDLSTWQLAVRW